MSTEICQRCKQEGSDRRTLWMAGLYDMNELHLPFEQVAVFGKPRRFVRDERRENYSMPPKQIFEDVPNAIEFQYKFYTLRVCKDCRGDWLMATKLWFDCADRD